MLPKVRLQLHLVDYILYLQHFDQKLMGKHQMSFSIQNGSNNYSYSWSNGDSTNNAISLSAGSYYCIVTDLNWQQCSDSVNFTISEPLELTSSYTQTNVSCFGADDGSTIVNFYGGTIGSAPNDTNYILGWAGTQLPFYLPYPQTVFNTNLLPAPGGFSK